jgi:leader peptidase (prepilin peptidase)/N-methyltransferase
VGVVILIFVFLTGMAVASFISSLIYRIPRDISIMHPPSFCPACGKRIKPYDLIPIFSFFLLKGKCRECGKRIPLHNLLLEVGLPLVYTGLYLRCGTGIVFFIRCFLMTQLVYCALIDLISGEIGILDVVVVSLGGVAALVLALFGVLPYRPWYLLSGAVAASILLGLSYSIVWLMKRRIPLGRGDLFLIPAAMLSFGLYEALRILVFSSVLGIVVAFVLFRTGRLGKHSPLPLLPFFTTGVLIEILLFSC